MRVLELTGRGPKDLKFGERPAPVPGRGDAVVEIRAAALNYRDLAIIRGDYGVGYPDPFVLGSDGAGVVVAVGPDVDPQHLGQRVVIAYVLDWIDGPATAARTARRLGGPTDGVFAEQVVVPAHALVRVPSDMDLRDAATLPVAGVTAWRGLVRLAGLESAHTVLVHGMGGLSTFALTLARARGARAIVVTTGNAKRSRARELGASAVVDRSQPTWPAEVSALTGGEGVDVVLDVAGGPTLAGSVEALRVGGTLLVSGFAGDPLAQIDVRTWLRRGLTLHALSAGSRADLEALVAFVHQTGMRPTIDRVVAFGEAPSALRDLSLDGHIGKVVVTTASAAADGGDTCTSCC